MTQKNVAKLETMAEDFLQYRYKMWLKFGKRDADWNFYDSACAMIAAFGGQWRRNYHGGDTEGTDDIKNYSHTVWFPSNDTCQRLNEDAWKE